MNKQVLVAYASKYGGTAEIAEKIRDILSTTGLEVDLLPADQIRGLDGYHAVILGSAVYYGRWRKEAVRFLKTWEEELKMLPVWFFSSGPINQGNPVELLDGWTFPPQQQDLADRIEPKDIVVFHGMLDPSKLTRFENWVLEKMESPSGDFRDWDSIVSWAVQIGRELT